MTFQVLALIAAVALLGWALVTGNKPMILAMAGWLVLMGAWAVLA